MRFEISTCIHELNQRILPELGVGSADICGLLLAGSRATQDARPSSDFDLFALSRNGLAPIEYVGPLKTATPTGFIELKLVPVDQIIDFVKNAPIYQCHAIAQGQLLSDPTHALSTAQTVAQKRISSEVDRLRIEIESLNQNILLSMIQHAFLQAEEVLTYPGKSGDSTAKIARFSEYMLDFYIYTQMLILVKTGSIHSPDEASTIELLLQARGNRGGRFLNTSRYQLAPWYTGLSTRISVHLDSSYLSVNEKIALSLREMNSVFMDLIGEPLMPEFENRPEAATMLEQGNF